MAESERQTPALSCEARPEGATGVPRPCQPAPPWGPLHSGKWPQMRPSVAGTAVSTGVCACAWGPSGVAVWPPGVRAHAFLRASFLPDALLPPAARGRS